MNLPAPLEEKWNQVRAWRPTDDQRRKLKIAGYAGYMALALIFFTWIQLPWKAISGIVTAQISAWTGKNVSAEDVGLYRISGLEFDNLQIERPGTEPIKIEELAIRLELFPLLIGHNAVNGYVKLGGKSRFEARQQSGFVVVNGTFNEADLTSMFPEGKPTDFAIQGVLDGNFSYKTPGSQLTAASFNPAAAEGNLELTLAQGLLKGVNAGSLPIPALHVDDWRLTMAIKDGRLDVQKFDLKGPDADITMDGNISLAAPMANSRLNLKVKVTPKGDFGKTFGPLLSLQMRQEAGGSYGAYLQGTVGVPQFRQ